MESFTALLLWMGVIEWLYVLGCTYSDWSARLARIDNDAWERDRISFADECARERDEKAWIAACLRRSQEGRAKWLSAS